MAITTLDGLITAMDGTTQRLLVAKQTISGLLASGYGSYWRGVGQHTQGDIPTTAAICTKSTTGSFLYNNAGGSNKLYLTRAFMTGTQAGHDVQMHDRLAHIGGLSGTVTTAQTVDLSVTDASLDLRRGSSDYSDVLWFFEWYTSTGTTTAGATVTYTDQDDNTGQTVSVPAWGISMAPSRMVLINQFLPQGKRIKSIQTITLTVSTGTVGNFGLTATRLVTTISLGVANYGAVLDWAQLGLPVVQNNSCLFLMSALGTATAPALYGAFNMVEG